MSLSPIPQTIEESRTTEKVGLWVLQNNALFECDVNLFNNVMLHTFYSSVYKNYVKKTLTHKNGPTIVCLEQYENVTDYLYKIQNLSKYKNFIILINEAYLYKTLITTLSNYSN